MSSGHGVEAEIALVAVGDDEITVFFEAGRHALPGQPVVPEPPEAAVTGALAWAMRTDPGYRMLQRARSAVTEDQKDDFYAAAEDQARRGPDPAIFDPQTPGFRSCVAR
jgi:hypothetical protein